MPKHIKVSCYGPIAVSRKYQSPWEDVWLRWTGKPGRKRCRLAPCLVSRTDLEHTLAFEKEFYSECKNADDADLRELSHALVMVERNGMWSDFRGETPTVYTNKEYINRDEAEKMIAYLMKDKGFYDIICGWKRPNGFVVIPM